MGLAKLIALLMVLLLLGSTFAGLVVYFIKWVHVKIEIFISKDDEKIYGQINILWIKQNG